MAGRLPDRRGGGRRGRVLDRLRFAARSAAAVAAPCGGAAVPSTTPTCSSWRRSSARGWASGGRWSVRSEAGLAMPATIGWRRPVILLPPDWSGWDDRERCRVVLSHELAHIRRDDYLAGIGAQLSLAAPVLSPAGRTWLAGRHRLGQELARRCVGRCAVLGRESSLPDSSRSPAWPLRNEQPRSVGCGRPVILPGTRDLPEEDRGAARDARELSPAPLSRRRPRDGPGGPRGWPCSLWPVTAAAGPHIEVLAAMPAQEGGDAARGRLASRPTRGWSP